MKKRNIFLIIITFFPILALPSIVSSTNLEDLSASVVYLRDCDGLECKIGTGFLVNLKQPYLVTASHVAKLITPKGFMIWSSKNGHPVKLHLPT